MKKLFWKILGFLSLGMAYIGVITPGIPYSIFVVFAAYCFSKGSERMHAWIYNLHDDNQFDHHVVDSSAGSWYNIHSNVHDAGSNMGLEIPQFS